MNASDFKVFKYVYMKRRLVVNAIEFSADRICQMPIRIYDWVKTFHNYDEFITDINGVIDDSKVDCVSIYFQMWKDDQELKHQEELRVIEQRFQQKEEAQRKKNQFSQKNIRSSVRTNNDNKIVTSKINYKESQEASKIRRLNMLKYEKEINDALCDIILVKENHDKTIKKLITQISPIKPKINKYPDMSISDYINSSDGYGYDQSERFMFHGYTRHGIQISEGGYWKKAYRPPQ